ncbi:hypothetical protein GCM10010174_84900 [Kutzneria viridogrisea]
MVAGSTSAVTGTSASVQVTVGAVADAGWGAASIPATTAHPANKEVARRGRDLTELALLRSTWQRGEQGIAS